ncbi:MAG: hypothetical protein ACLRL4_08990 [Bifidobacterium bifidum]
MLRLLLLLGLLLLSLLLLLFGLPLLFRFGLFLLLGLLSRGFLGGFAIRLFLRSSWRPPLRPSSSRPRRQPHYARYITGVSSFDTDTTDQSFCSLTLSPLSVLTE